MYSLILDSSTKILYVCLVKDNEVVFEKEITERDIKILQGLAEGKDDKEIAEVIGFSHQTVNAAFPKIMFKLGAVNRYNALYIALKRKLIK